MADKRENGQNPLPHNLILEARSRLTVSGVSDMDSFDEQTIVLFTEMGELTVKGEELHINKLNVDTGELTLEGQVHTLVYNDDSNRRQQGFWSRLFR